MNRSATRASGEAMLGPVARPSGLDEAVARVGDRWSLLIVAALVDGPLTFGDLLDELGVAPNVLSRRLKHLEAAQVVAATPYSRRPPRFRYQLTGAGEELAGPLRLLAQWGDRARGGEGFHHETCGTELEARWYCPTCDVVIADSETNELRYL